MCDKKTKEKRMACYREFFNCDDYNCIYYIMCYNMANKEPIK